jgi:hypothetical protein
MKSKVSEKYAISLADILLSGRILLNTFKKLLLFAILASEIRCA